MNAVRNLSATALVLALGLSSCQKDQQLEPQAPVAHADNDRAKYVGNIYTLTKHGNASLTYDAAERLKQVTYAGGGVSHVDYSYGTLRTGENYARAVSYLSSTGKINSDCIFLLNASGRCYEERQLMYFYFGGNTSSQLDVYRYDYDAQGRLTKRYDKNNPNQHYEYFFNADGDLTKVITHAPNTGVPSAETTFSYTEYVGAPLRNDRYPLNELVNGLPEDYLRIFGKASKHLAYRQVYKNLYSNTVQSDRSFAYFFNADGYVTQKNVSTVGEQAVAMTPYEYQVTMSF